MRNIANNVFLGTLALLLPITFAWADGQVISVKGNAQIDRGNDPTNAEPGSAVFAMDALRTDTASGISVQMADDALLYMGSEGELVIRSFRAPDFQGAEGSNAGEAIYHQKAGTLRVVTGLISQLDPQAQRIESDYASIVAHGTDIESTICDAACVTEGKGERGQYVGVRAGSITVSNDKGSIDAGTGNWVFIAADSAPVASPQRRFTPDAPPSMRRGDMLPERPNSPPRIEEPPPEDPVVSPS